MLKYLVVTLSLLFAAPALGHIDGKFLKGPNGGHVIDAGDGKQHWELVASGSDLTLYVTDKADKPVDTVGGAAEAQVLVAGKTFAVALVPAGGNTLKGSGDFNSAKGMRVIVKTTKVGGESFQARLTPLQ